MKNVCKAKTYTCKLLLSVKTPVNSLLQHRIYFNIQSRDIYKHYPKREKQGGAREEMKMKKKKKKPSL